MVGSDYFIDPLPEARLGKGKDFAAWINLYQLHSCFSIKAQTISLPIIAKEDDGLERFVQRFRVDLRCFGRAAVEIDTKVAGTSNLMKELHVVLWIALFQ